MKAAVLCESKKPLKIQELELPNLEKGQVLARILYTGVCRAQINEINAHKGPDMYLPHTLGHEASAIIEEIGEEVTKVKKGDYVTLTWIKGEGIDVPSCNYIRKEDNKKINSGAITTFNEYSVVSENRVVKIPKEIPPQIGSLLGCAIPTGVGIIYNELKAKKENSLAIFGMGGIGMAALLGAQASEVSTIIAIDINDDKLKFAKENGATHTLNPNKDEVVAKIKKITGEGVDFAIDCVGIPKITENAFESVNYNGLCVIAGNAGKGEKICLTPFEFIKGKKLVGTWGGASKPDEDIPKYAKQYLDGKLKIDKLVSKIYSHDQINEAIKDVEDGKIVRAIIKISDI